MPPTRIDQVLPSIVGRDAIGHHTLEAQRVLRSLGFVSEIFAEGIGRELSGLAHPLSELPRLSPTRQWLCYQASTGSKVAETFAGHPACKLLDYHNITPAEELDGWLPELADELRRGRSEVAALAPSVSFALADSAYNKGELDAWGYRRSVVSPLMLSPENLAAAPDRRLSARLARDKAAGGADWLFVGQLLPHKAQHDVVAGFASYKKAYDPAARLRLVGRRRAPRYAESLLQLAGALGVAEAVHLEESVSPTELSALYLGCDLYVSCSGHEGFSAPLIEAMHHGLPVVAFAAGAVPETLGEAGLLLDSKAPALVAAAAERLMRDGQLRERLLRAGRQRAEDFSPAKARARFAASIEQAVALG